jgi:hypothetical protein
LPEVRYDYEQQAYLINSKPLVITQLRRCLRHHARRAKWPGTLRRNFVTRQDEEW